MKPNGSVMAPGHPSPTIFGDTPGRPHYRVQPSLSAPHPGLPGRHQWEPGLFSGAMGTHWNLTTFTTPLYHRLLVAINSHLDYCSRLLTGLPASALTPMVWSTQQPERSYQEQGRSCPPSPLALFPAWPPHFMPCAGDTLTAGHRHSPFPTCTPSLHPENHPLSSATASAGHLLWVALHSAGRPGILVLHLAYSSCVSCLPELSTGTQTPHEKKNRTSIFPNEPPWGFCLSYPFHRPHVLGGSAACTQ